MSAARSFFVATVLVGIVAALLLAHLSVPVLGCAAHNHHHHHENSFECSLMANPMGDPEPNVRLDPAVYESVLKAVEGHNDRLARSGERRSVGVGQFDFQFGFMNADTTTAVLASAEILGRVLNYNATAPRIVVRCNEEPLSGLQLGYAYSTAGASNVMCNVPTSDPYIRVSAPYFRMATNGTTCDTVNGVDIIVKLTNASGVQWNKNVDATPTFSQYDMVTVVTHELLHGLGFNTVVGNISFPLLLKNLQNSGACPGCYHKFDGRLYSSSTGFFMANMTDPVLQSMFIGSSLFWVPSATNATTPTMRIYTPTTFASGSTGSHWDNTIPCPGCLSSNANGLMRPQLNPGTSIHTIGFNTETVLREYGYAVRDCSAYSSCTSCLAGSCSWCYTDGKCGDGAGSYSCSNTTQWVVQTNYCATGNPVTNPISAAATLDSLLFF